MSFKTSIANQKKKPPSSFPTFQTLQSTFHHLQSMEGLIPFIYRTIKRRKTRRYYKCLSSGMAQRFDSDSNLHANGHKFLPPPSDKLEVFHEDRKTHRRYRSLEEFSSDLYSPKEYEDRPRFAKDVRFGSRRMFACISGA